MSLRKSILAAALSLTAATMISGTAGAAIDIGVSINVAPPELPVYEQPAIPGPGYLWTPGYWAWGGSDYYWVPGTWVLAPQPGYLWTPGYWGWADGAYLWHAGYWGPQVGFYGGVNYGYGYGGNGYEGGEWRGGSFYYNRSVSNIPGNVHITNVYNRTVVNNVTVNRVSFNGGNGGVTARPTQAQLAAEHEHHLAPVGAQVRQEQLARSRPELHANSNHGAPAIAATSRPGNFSGAGVVGARGAGAVASHASAPAPHGAAAAVETHPAASHPPTARPEAHSFRPEQPGGAGPAGAPHESPPPHN
ncbi:MAG: YXWGXW repeat-containing protein, partial [Steroidobacteraceae bacterium]